MGNCHTRDIKLINSSKAVGVISYAKLMVVHQDTVEVCKFDTLAILYTLTETNENPSPLKSINNANTPPPFFVPSPSGGVHE